MFKVGDRVVSIHHAAPRMVGTIIEIREKLDAGFVATVEFQARRPWSRILAPYGTDALRLYQDGLERAAKKCSK